MWLYLRQYLKGIVDDSNLPRKVAVPKCGECEPVRRCTPATKYYLPQVAEKRCMLY